MSDLKGHKGTQLTAHVATRATIQTAVILASGLGTNESKKSPTFRNAACELLFGALRTDLPNMNIFELDELTQDKKHIRGFDDWKTANRNADDLAKEVMKHDDLKVDLALTPVDGADAVREGVSGSVSAVAAGPPGCFVRPRNVSAYFAVAIGAKQLDEAMTKRLAEYDSFLIPNTRPLLANFVGATFKLIDTAVGAHQSVPPVVAIMLEGDRYKTWHPVIESWHRQRRLQGSAVAAALAAFLGKVPYAIFVARLPQMIQAAVAAWTRRAGLCPALARAGRCKEQASDGRWRANCVRRRFRKGRPCNRVLHIDKRSVRLESGPIRFRRHG